MPRWIFNKHSEEVAHLLVAASRPSDLMQKNSCLKVSACLVASQKSMCVAAVSFCEKQKIWRPPRKKGVRLDPERGSTPPGRCWVLHLPLTVAPLRTGCIVSSVLYVWGMLMRGSLLLPLHCDPTCVSSERFSRTADVAGLRVNMSGLWSLPEITTRIHSRCECVRCIARPAFLHRRGMEAD